LGRGVPRVQHAHVAGAASAPIQEAEHLPDPARRVVLIISGHLDIDPIVQRWNCLVPETSLVDDLGADSVDSIGSAPFAGMCILLTGK
jgi:hypothetical protein